MVIVTTPRSDSGEFASFSRSKSDSRRKQQHASSNTPTSRTNNLSTMMHMEVKHKSIKIPAVHNNKDEGDDDYIRRKLKQEYNRSSRSLDRSSGQSKSRKSRSCSAGRQSTHHQNEHPLVSRTGSIRRMRKQSSRREVNLSRSKSSRINPQQHPCSPGSLTDTNKSYSSSRTLSTSSITLGSSNSSNSGRRAPAQRGISRSKSSRIEAEEPSSPGSLSKTNRSNSSNNSYNSNSSQPNRRLRRARSLDASTRSLPREDYVLTTRSSSRKLIGDPSESEMSMTETTRSSSTSSGSSKPKRSGCKNRSKNRLDTSSRSKQLTRSTSYKLEGKTSTSNNSKLSNSSGSTGLSSLSECTRLSSSSESTNSSHQPSVTDSTSTTTFIQGKSKSSNTSHNNSEGLKRVSWKSDPKTGFSDWTLHVVYRDSKNKRKVNVYHLHKNIVAYGNRKSNYVLRDIMDSELKELFDSTNETELEIKKLIVSNSSKKKKSNTEKIPNLTILKLPNEAQAAVVPMVLDFMYYTNETNQRMSADRSCNVFKVAEGLKIRALQTAISEFYEANLSLQNMREFLQAATRTRANMLLAICKAKIRQMIDFQPDLSEMVPEEFLPDILDQSYHSIKSNLLDKSGQSRSKKKKQVFRLCSDKSLSNRCDLENYAQ